MKLKEFKREKDNYINKTVKITLHNGQKYRGSFYFENDRVRVGNGNVLVKDIKTVEIISDNTLYKYISVSYNDDYAGRTYSYKTTIKNIEVGDTVLVDRNGCDAYGTVEAINYYTEDNAPYPVEKTKDIIEVIEEFEDYKDYYDEDEMITDYHNILLNAMFGRISIKRLIKLIAPRNGEDEYTLFYYPKFNTFFYKIADDKYRMAEYSTNVIDNKMFRIMEKDSIEVPQKRYAMTNDSESYVRSINFCRENMLVFHDDTDVLEFCDEKREIYKNRPKYEEPKEFESLEEIKNYLKEYKGAQYRVPDPEYIIEKNDIVHYVGWLSYDMRVFKITKFLRENGYVFPEYYDNEKYEYLFKEELTDEKIKTFGIAEVSYIIIRSFNIERICEGTVDYLAKSGELLKLIERAEQIKQEFANK